MPRAGLLFLLALLACRRSAGPRQAGADELEAHWSDSAGGAVTLLAPAEAFWCARDTLLEVLAVHNDSAVGLALYARDSVRAEGYPLFQASMFAPWRPQSAAAVRLLTATELRGFESTWGQVTVTEAGSSRVSGTFDVHLKRQVAGDSLHVTGRFTRVAVQPAAVSCGRANKPRPR
jgi:hypothetical protein